GAEPVEPRTYQNRTGRINHALRDNSDDIASVRDVVNPIRIENDKISEIAVFNLADMRANVAAEKFRRVCSCALKNLHWRQSRFFHQLKFTEKRRAMNCADVSRVCSRCNRDACILQSLQI